MLTNKLKFSKLNEKLRKLCLQVIVIVLKSMKIATQKWTKLELQGKQYYVQN